MYRSYLNMHPTFRHRRSSHRRMCAEARTLAWTQRRRFCVLFFLSLLLLSLRAPSITPASKSKKRTVLSQDHTQDHCEYFINCTWYIETRGQFPSNRCPNFRSRERREIISGARLNDWKMAIYAGKNGKSRTWHLEFIPFVRFTFPTFDVSISERRRASFEQ